MGGNIDHKKSFEYVYVKLGELCFPDEKHSFLNTALYKALQADDMEMYKEAYRRGHPSCSLAQEEWEYKKIEDLRNSIAQEGYRPDKGIIVIKKGNIVLNGYHRTCILLHQFGPEYEIMALQQK